MVYGAKNKILYFNGKSMNYVTFGQGKRPLLIIPGLGDGLSTVKGMAQFLSLSYRMMAKQYKVYVFSRINELPEKYSTKEMANDIAEAMAMLNISPANIMGISQGGMIAQYLALDFPQMIEKLILVVTAGRMNTLSQERIGHWLTLSQNSSYKDLVLDIAVHSYTAKSFAYLKYLYRILGTFGKIKNKQRIMTQSQACLHHNTLAKLQELQCQTLIIGAKEDDVLGVESSKELSAYIKNSSIKILKNCGHALFEQNKELQKTALAFLENRDILDEKGKQ
ncbi:alpha/beta fold hydrolase [Streptococcus macacae]|uniref:Hydrolase, alpha/beta domain protein n=1 Tax=Streptococcus macacae NCTC 11558 TaxID=764298 RepID=G5JVE8_9STRE|nr:alpha/beta hydrolase [Streptococcus macacae]EHJ52385.1 hydrolase, alpha/beta domain protein [Streptococcus macacae NCTC 11558]SUN78544.1 HydD [Streptococcus macacae NCTC 11558]